MIVLRFSQLSLEFWRKDTNKAHGEKTIPSPTNQEGAKYTVCLRMMHSALSRKRKSPVSIAYIFYCFLMNEWYTAIKHQQKSLPLMCFLCQVQLLHQVSSSSLSAYFWYFLVFCLWNQKKREANRTPRWEKATNLNVVLNITLLTV